MCNEDHHVNKYNNKRSNNTTNKKKKKEGKIEKTQLKIKTTKALIAPRIDKHKDYTKNALQWNWTDLLGTTLPVTTDPTTNKRIDLG